MATAPAAATIARAAAVVNIATCLTGGLLLTLDTQALANTTLTETLASAQAAVSHFPEYEDLLRKCPVVAVVLSKFEGCLTGVNMLSMS